MEDAIEEVVGEIYDEHDEVEKEIIDKKNDNEYVIDPDLDIKELFDMLEIEHLPESEYSSVGGFLFGMLSEELPEEGKVIVYKTVDERVVDGVYVSVLVEIHFTLTKVEDNRIKEIYVKVIDVNGENKDAKEDEDVSDFDEPNNEKASIEDATEITEDESNKSKEKSDDEKSSKAKIKK
jgi:CBS domain containing-hemolysin-like protein